MLPSGCKRLTRHPNGKLAAVQIELAIIGGTGINSGILTQTMSERVVTTRFGSADVTIGLIGSTPAALLHRHGLGHKIPPHGIAHRANIAALASIGVRAIYATTAVGSLDTSIHPGDIVLLDDLIDLTRNQSERTFFTDSVIHTDVTPPYSPQLRAAFIEAAAVINQTIRPDGTYVCTDGPRFETPAEIRMMAHLGGDVVGMTGANEAMLAIEAGMHYCGASVVTNYGAGLTSDGIAHESVHDIVVGVAPKLQQILIEAISGRTFDELPVRGSGKFQP
jgi:5'-methylthioadenosine phosphorylase